MIKSLLIIIAIVAIIYFLKFFRRIPAKDKPKAAIKYGLYIAAIVVIGLVLTGKLHWVAAGIAGLLPIAQRLFFAGTRFVPFLKQMNIFRKQKEQRSQTATPPTSGNTMNVDKAKDIFGIKTLDSSEQIIRRHRELMQKNHPDRGGSDYLATQINEAKACLIKHLKTG